MQENGAYGYPGVSPVAQTMEHLKADPTYRALYRLDVDPIKAGIRAGLGVKGRNGLLLTPAYGPRVKIAVFLTDVEMEYDKALENVDYCSKCNICEEECPKQAIVGFGQVDKSRCITVTNEFGHSMVYIKGPKCPAPCIVSCPVGSERVPFKPEARAEEWVITKLKNF
jgi:ferredoxin